MHSWLKLLTVSAFLLFLLPFPTLLVNASSEDVFTVPLTEAEEAFTSAYEAVFEAEQAGANVSGLFGQLNIAGEYLSEAYVWYRSGDSENTSRFAGLCYDVVEDLKSEAVELRDEAKRFGETDFVVKMIGSVVGVIVVVVSGYAVWHVFKRRYRRQVLGLRPEVVSCES